MAETKGKPSSKATEPPEDRTNAEKSESWRAKAASRDDREASKKRPSGIEVVMTKRPPQQPKAKQKEVRFDVPSLADDEVEAPYRGVPEVHRGDILKTRKVANENAPPTKERAYKLVAPRDEPGNTEAVVQELWDSLISIKLGRLVQASSAVAKALRTAVTKRRVSFPQGAVDVFAQQADLPYMEDEITALKVEYDAIEIQELPPVYGVYISTEEDRRLDGRIEIGNVVVPDPYLIYLSTLGPDEVPRQVYVSKESASLRVIYSMVNEKCVVECVIDSGSQIVSMSLEKAKEVGLTWDPDVQIYMQSANGQLKKSVGLSRNVPFVFGDITVYLQVHIIDQPAYKVLLGRPFDILTESSINNKSDGSQTVTLKDPNTLKRCTLPTYARGTFATTRKPASNAGAESAPPPPHKTVGQARSKKATVESVPDEEDEEFEGDNDFTSDDAEPPTESDDEEGGFHQSSMN